MIPGYTAEQLRRIVQGSAEWLEARRGCLGASGVSNAVATRKRGESELETRRKYKLQIVAERRGAWATPHYVNDAMRWGIENEPLARTAYELRYGAEVDTVGIIAHPTIDMSLCSPDGMVSMDGMVEYKCPNTDTHYDYMDRGILPREYKPQVYWQLACNPDRDWCDFVSFDPRVPSRDQLFRIRVFRDAQYIAELESGVVQFFAEVNALNARLDELNPEVLPADKLKQELEDSLRLTGDHDSDLRTVADSLFGSPDWLTA